MVVFNVMGHGESSAREARAKILVYIYILEAYAIPPTPLVFSNVFTLGGLITGLQALAVDSLCSAAFQVCIVSMIMWLCMLFLCSH